ncbi:hypothetical protein C1646_764905 [Rhizophagus diaphanus]|nr:hypothetical protein C1646_764905 [Rhizophagus diaphanus] [Rhizophagus sp. MUCL 43196]
MSQLPFNKKTLTKYVNPSASARSYLALTISTTMEYSSLTWTARCKLLHLIKKYEKVKKYNNQSSVDRKDWCWYDQLDEIFGTRENIIPSFLANKSISIIDQKETEIKKEGYKK